MCTYSLDPITSTIASTCYRFTSTSDMFAVIQTVSTLLKNLVKLVCITD